MTDDKPTTKHRILEAAGEIFSESGFRQATIRGICSRAGVNIAAINYHFQGKDNLYIETLRYWKDIAFRKYPRELGTSESDTPEERLKGFIRSFVFRILDTGVESRFGRLMAMEYLDPTVALDVIVEEVSYPMYMFLTSLIGQITSQDPSGAFVRYCSSSIVSQCLFFLYARPVLRKLIGEDNVRSMAMEDIADHIYLFSLAALTGLRQNRTGVP